MRVNTRAVLEDCINKGLNGGYNRAHKYVENPPEGVIKDAIANEIWPVSYTHLTLPTKA